MEVVKRSNYERQNSGHHAGTQKERSTVFLLVIKGLGHEDTSKLASTMQQGTENISSMLPQSFYSVERAWGQ